MKTLSKKTPEWHTKVAAELNQEFAATNDIVLNARKRAGYLGLKFIWVKETGKADGSIPHGAWGDWLKANCPQIPFDTLQDYITEGRSLVEKMGWQMSELPTFETPPHKLLELSSANIPAKEHKAQQLLLDLVEARGKFRAVTEYKQVDDEGAPKRGVAKGSKGCTKVMRLNAKFKDADERLKGLAANIPMVSLWLKQNCTALGFPELKKLPNGAVLIASIREAVTDTHLFFQNQGKS